VILDHYSASANVAEFRVALRPTLPTPVSREDTEQYACKARKFFPEFDRLPLSRPFDLDRPETMEEFDTVVIGSDEVWNLRHPWYSGCLPFFGVGLRAQRVISYAASFGNFSCWEGIGAPWTDYLSRLDAISVRDENSWWMLKNCLGQETDLVLDPCLQFLLPPDGEPKPRAPYALVYGHNFSPGFAARVRRWADAKRLPLLSIGYRNDWADAQWLTAGPHDFAHAVAGAEAVATNFFHGCVFALQNERPFACELSPYRSIKVRGLMELLGGEAHLVGDDAPENALEPLMSEPLDPRIPARIVEVRAQSNDYLRRALLECDAR